MILGIGVDIVELERIAAILRRQPGFVTRVLTERERQGLKEASELRMVEYVAGRFAAKEAAAKALGTGIGACAGLHDIELLPSANGGPRLEIAQQVLDALFPAADRIVLHVSISHSKQYAVAQVVIEQV